MARDDTTISRRDGVANRRQSAPLSSPESSTGQPPTPVIYRRAEPADTEARMGGDVGPGPSRLARLPARQTNMHNRCGPRTQLWRRRGSCRSTQRKEHTGNCARNGPMKPRAERIVAKQHATNRPTNPSQTHSELKLLNPHQNVLPPTQE